MQHLVKKKKKRLALMRRSVSLLDFKSYEATLEENERLKTQIEELQQEHLQMENSVILKDSLIVKQECELEELRP